MTGSAAPTMTTLSRAHELLPGSALVGDGATAFARVHSDMKAVEAVPAAATQQ